MKKSILACMFAALLVPEVRTYAQDTLEIQTSYEGCNMFYSPYAVSLKITSILTESDSLRITYTVSNSNMANLRIAAATSLLQSPEKNSEEVSLLSQREQEAYLSQMLTYTFSREVHVFTANKRGTICFVRSEKVQYVEILLIGDRPNDMGAIALVFNLQIGGNGKVAIVKRSVRSAETGPKNCYTHQNRPPCAVPQYPPLN